ncbi:hypothetical protein PoB_003617900 [Plakobranchus ocellatus]|uniref:Uncharacterized protein n=1 Tax=Plakobranchus ocellatus TaxID=259542 RepID=A0AAV4AU85_9GAST|nr:hypothetical protein PoB_003617900 [Plakobranchus ocellatus]
MWSKECCLSQDWEEEVVVVREVGALNRKCSLPERYYLQSNIPILQRPHSWRTKVAFNIKMSIQISLIVILAQMVSKPIFPPSPAAWRHANRSSGLNRVDPVKNTWVAPNPLVKRY